MIAGARNVVFPYQMLVVSPECNLGCEAGCGLTVSCLDHGSFYGRPRIANDVSRVFWIFVCILGM